MEDDVERKRIKKANIGKALNMSSNEKTLFHSLIIILYLKK